MSDTEGVPQESFVGTIRIAFTDVSEISATITMDRLAEICAEHLDEDDSVVVSQVVPFSTPTSPEEVLNVLKRARNALIRSRLQPAYDIARELDMQIWQIDPTLLGQYDYSRMPDFTTRIFINKEDPNE